MEISLLLGSICVGRKLTAPMPITAKNEGHEIEKSLFEMVNLAIALIMSYFLIRNLIYGSTLGTKLLDVGLITMGSSFYYTSKFRGTYKPLILPLILLLAGFLTFFWYWLSGALGGTAIGAIAVATVSIILVPSQHKRLVFLGFSFLLGFLIFSQQHTNWVREDPRVFASHTYTEYFIFSVFIIFLFYYLKRKFDQERALVLNQNAELENLNRSLAQNIRDKEVVIDNLERTQGQLIESEKMASIGHFTAGIAHEINNPLNFVRGSIPHVIKNLDDLETSVNSHLKEDQKQNIQEAKTLLEHMDQGTGHITSILGNLLKITPNLISDSRRPIDLRDLLKNTYHLVKNASPEIKIGLSAEEQITIVAEPVEFNQILLNLLKNSVDALEGKEDARINLALSRTENDQFQIAVGDNGSGIPRSIQSKVFDPFFTTKPPGKGTGVGLYIVYSLVKKYGGSIRIDSQENEGTTFLLTFPLDNSDSN